MTLNLRIARGTRKFFNVNMRQNKRKNYEKHLVMLKNVLVPGLGCQSLLKTF